MKKQTLPLVILMGFFMTAHAQVGINNSAPTATLDVTAKNAAGPATNVDGLLIPRVDRQRAQGMLSVPTSTLIYVNNVATGGQAGTAININAVGYYYFDGIANAWVKLNPSAAADINIYKDDGTLTGNRTVTQNANTLAFNATATNAFSVDGNTFSVDAANDRIGIGTTTPVAKLHVEGNEFINAPATSGPIKNALDINVGQDAVAWGNRTDNFGINMRTASSVQTGSIARINFGDTSVATNNGTRYLSFSVGKTLNELMYLTDANGGNVGIGNTAPTARLEVTSGTANTSGVKLTNLTSASPIGTGQSLGVDASGNVITVANPVAPTPDINIYKDDGTLTGNRTVTQNANTLAFNGTATNAFSVDGNTFSVDAANNRVGIGTSAPSSRLHLGTDIGSTATDVVGKKLAIYNDAAGTDFYGLGVSAATLQFHAASTASEAPGMVLNGGGNVGIGNTAPTARLEVTSGTANTSGVKLTNLTSASPIGTGQSLGIDASGNVITVANPTADINIYKDDGTLTGNRTVTQGANTLAFNGTATNAFSVDGTTLSVDAANDRLGIGTTTPTAKLDIIGTTFGIKNSAGSGSWDNLWFNASNTSSSINASGAELGLQFKVGTNFVGSYGDGGQVLATVATMLPNGNTGIGTTTPNNRLDLGTNIGSSITDVTGKKLAVYNAADGSDFYGLGASAATLQFHAASTASEAPGMVLNGGGNVGIGTTAPSAQLHTTGTVRFQNYPSYSLLGTDANGNLVAASDLGIPRPAVYTLQTGVNNFLNGVGAGFNQSVPMVETANYTGVNGVTFNAGTNTLTFQPGLYQMTFVYEAIHNNTGCTLSSHIVDFPIGSGAAFQRVHSTASHIEGPFSNYGGAVTYTGRITAVHNWQIALGRGISGNCTGTGNDLVAGSTQFSVIRIGN